MTVDEKAQFKVMQEQLGNLTNDMRDIKEAIIGNKNFGQEGLVTKFIDHEKRITTLEKKFDRVWWIAMGVAVPFSMGIIEIFKYIKTFIH